MRAEMPEEHSRLFAEHGLTNRHASMCVQLVAAAGLSVGELAARMGMATASELVGDLDRSGWACRDPDPANRCRTLVSLLPDRRAHMEEFVSRRAVPLLRALDRLTPGRREGFAAGPQVRASELEAS